MQDHSSFELRRQPRSTEEELGHGEQSTPSVCAMPAISLELSDDGLPIGVQCICPMFEDRTPLHFAEPLERERGFVPPTLG